MIENTQVPMMLTENDKDYATCINAGDDLNYWLVKEEPAAREGS